MIISAIAAVAENGVIGHQGDLPWSLPDDMAWFQRVTKGHHVITGRKNYESIPAKYRPLKGRVNLVVTRNATYEAPGAIVVPSIEAGIERARAAGETELFVIGGGEVYTYAFRNGLVQRFYLSEVHAGIEGDTHFPELDSRHWREVSAEHHPADERHAHAFTMKVLERMPGPAPGPAGRPD